MERQSAALTFDEDAAGAFGQPFVPLGLGLAVLTLFGLESHGVAQDEFHLAGFSVGQTGDGLDAGLEKRACARRVEQRDLDEIAEFTLDAEVQTILELGQQELQARPSLEKEGNGRKEIGATRDRAKQKRTQEAKDEEKHEKERE